MRPIAPLLGLMLSGCVATPPREIVVLAGTLFDGEAARARMRVVIRDGAIVAVEPDDGALPDGERLVVDARELTVLPGLVDAHTHLFSGGGCSPGVGVGPGQALDNLAAWTRGGVTTVADLGAPAGVALALRRHVGTARHRGPRLLVAGPLLTAPGGYPVDLFGTASVELGLVVEVASPVAARAAVRRLAAEGVDLIKVALQEQSYAGAPLPLLDRDVLAALVDEAHQQELRVAAHVITNAATAAALDAGVDLLAHVALEPLDEALVDRLRATGTVVVPTLEVFAAQLGGAALRGRLFAPGAGVALSPAVRADLERYLAEEARGGPTLPPFFARGLERARVTAGVAAARANVARLAAAGVHLGFGTDSGPCLNPHGSPLAELERLAEAGVPPQALLALATRGGARALNLHDALGLVRPGFRADLIAVDGDPLTDLGALGRVRLVMIDGVLQRPADSVFDRLFGFLRLAFASR